MRNLRFHRMVIGLVLLLTIDIGSAAAGESPQGKYDPKQVRLQGQVGAIAEECFPILFQLSFSHPADRFDDAIDTPLDSTGQPSELFDLRAQKNTGCRRVAPAAFAVFEWVLRVSEWNLTLRGPFGSQGFESFYSPAGIPIE